MTEGKKPTSLDDLDVRLRAAQKHRDDAFGKGANKGRAGKGQSGIGFAFKIGADIVSALIVGVGIGLLLDNWLETKPWFLVLFFILGAAAGFMNVFRTVRGLEMTAGYQKPGRIEDKSKAAPEKGREEG
jgi:ATP synthase protein I